MFQPEVKLEFVRRYCPPKAGWKVFVDIDASEEGRTGTWKGPDAKKRRRTMQDDAARVRCELEALGVTVGGSRAGWFKEHGLPSIRGDRDIVAFHQQKRACVIAEVEGESSGQPEQKLYKAIGQLVMATSAGKLKGWKQTLVLVVHGEEIAMHLGRAKALEKLGISGLALGKTRAGDDWLFGDPMPRMLSGLSGELRVPSGGKSVNHTT
jgi:hypothetical protein